MMDMKITEVNCKTALSPSRLPGLTYSLNPYRGCQHQCRYCYVPHVLKINREQWGRFVDVKTNIPLILSKEIKKKKPGVVGISTVTDPYQPLEKKYNLTRYCLEQLLLHDFPVSIQTKSCLVTRDIDILRQFTHAEVMISIATINDQERQLLEPYSSSIEERLSALQTCSNAGLTTSIFFGPIYPTIDIQDISGILDTFIMSGISKIWIDSFNLKPGLWEHMNQTVSKNKNINTIFSKNVFDNKQYYNEIREEIKRKGKQKAIKIVDAF